MTDLAELLLPFEGRGREEQVVVLCHLVSSAVTIDADELSAAIRRAQLLLATGGDPRRELELDGRAVTALAGDLDTPERRLELAQGLAILTGPLARLPSLAATQALLRADADLASRGLAAALLADSLVEDG